MNRMCLIHFWISHSILFVFCLINIIFVILLFLSSLSLSLSIYIYIYIYQTRASTIDEALQQFTRIETLSEDNQYRCEQFASSSLTHSLLYACIHPSIFSLSSLLSIYLFPLSITPPPFLPLQLPSTQLCPKAYDHP